MRILYRYKRSEYAAQGIPEYWIVDAQKARITLLTLVDGLYEEIVFQKTDIIKSGTFPILDVTAVQVLTAGQV
ncbi:MAG: Uma2 family endonuclease [Nostoc sp.]|uniref:Uma2 family endonuclease n=1 Tax=Nostoc sp. TaxID=1180 RepID=UPI002FF915D0